VSRAESGFRPPGMMLPLVDLLSPARHPFSPPTPSSYWMAWHVESVLGGSVGADNCMGDTVPLSLACAWGVGFGGLGDCDGLEALVGCEVGRLAGWQSGS
jgi:hypothetical protein